MTSRIFLHVGSPKTGTTFLQQVLWSHKQLARERGLLLPLGSFHDHYLATLDVRGLADRPDSPPRTEGAWRRLVDRAESWDGNVLISHELFAGATAEQAKAALAAFSPESEVHVVLTARDLVRQIPAEWQEHVKHRAHRTFPAFVEMLRREEPGTWFWTVQDYAAILERWAAGVPASRMHVVTVPPPGNPPQVLWDRFAALLDLDPAGFDLGGSRSNTSLGYEQAELLRRVNRELGDRLPLPGPYPLDVKAVFAERLLASRPGTKFGLSGETLDFALQRSRRIVDRLREMDVNVVGDLDELTRPPDPATVTPLPRLSRKVLLDESVAALAMLLEEHSERRQEAQRAQAELADLRRKLGERPVRSVLVGFSERWPAVMTARRGYWRLVNRARDVRRRTHALRARRGQE